MACIQCHKEISNYENFMEAEHEFVHTGCATQFLRDYYEARKKDYEARKNMLPNIEQETLLDLLAELQHQVDNEK